MIPITFETRMNVNSENTSGKNLMPSWPPLFLIMPATNS
jgi:hypothetical protein